VLAFHSMGAATATTTPWHGGSYVAAARGVSFVDAAAASAITRGSPLDPRLFEAPALNDAALQAFPIWC
jgi:hypothetical protein